MTVAVDNREQVYKQLIAYVEKLGAPVLPLFGLRDGHCTCTKGEACGKNAGKHPHHKFVSSGVKDATLDRNRIKSWVNANGNASNWGIATGKALVGGGYLIVLDVDPRNGGDDSLEHLIAEHGPLPETPYALTGGGGYHYLFRVPTPPSSTVIAPGLDIKGDGGYIVVAPSTHHSGGVYSWEVLHDIEDVAIADAPAWIADGKSKKPRPPWTGAKAKDSIIGAAFELAGWLGHEITDGRHTVHCPWAHEHSDGRGKGGDSSTVILPPSKEAASGGFSCQHEHCREKTWQDAMNALPVDAARAARAKFRVAENKIVVPGTNAVVTAGLLPDQMAELREHLMYTRTKDGKPGSLKKDLVNATTILKRDPRWAQILTYDFFSNTIMVNREPPWHHDDRAEGVDRVYPRQWVDDDDIRCSLWMSRTWGLEFEVAKINQAVLVASQSNGVHPVRSYLRSLEWDGVPRVHQWLTKYCGAEDKAYVSNVGTWWLISAVARVMQPGCEAHHVLILEGPQGIGKSTALKILGGPWFTDSNINLGDKDSYQIIRGRWIIELAELDALSRSEASRAKAFFTSPTDTYRPSYGRAVISVKRQCVFAGSVNHAEYLRDETGNRRYWPVRCTSIDFKALEADRNQLWAEAFKLYESGTKWWPAEDTERRDCQDEVALREIGDEWENVIRDWLDTPDCVALCRTKGGVTVGDALHHALGVPPANWSTADINRATRCLVRIGCSKFRNTNGAWVFTR